jgi:N-acetylneuraminic acid mutarotase
MSVGEWIKVISQGNVFTPRTGHECIFANGSIYLFGGTDDEERLNDLYSYNVRKNKWQKIEPNGELPQPRSGTRGVYFNEGIYFFGGY